MTTAQTAKSVLFDFDGTLANTFSVIVSSYRYAFDKVLGIDFPATDEDYVTVRSLRFLELCNHVAGGRAPESVVAFRERYLNAPEGEVHLFAGIDGVLSGLAQRGTRMAIVTNKTRVALDVDLARLPLDVSRFEAVVTAEQSPEGKPHPRPLLIGLKALGVSPTEAVYVGDGPHDVVAACAAGMPMVGVAYGDWGADVLQEAGAEVIIDEPRELLTAVDSWSVTA